MNQSLNIHLKPYETINLDLDIETINNLNEIAKELNMSVETLCEKFFLNAVSKEIEINELKKLSNDEILNNHWIICENKIPKVRIIPL